jgi:fatty-acyl-CoA synthase
MSPRTYDWIAHHAARRPKAIPAVDLASGRRLSYRVLDRRIAALARRLREACNVMTGARVALLAHNAPLLPLTVACPIW